MLSIARSRLALLRWCAVLVMCLATPIVQDMLTDVGSWVAGTDCCSDDCEETGSPCSQECAHCAAQIRTPLSPTASAVALPVRVVRQRLSPAPRGQVLTGHLDPPFRPPVG